MFILQEESNKLNCKDEVLNLTKQLVQIPSIVNTEGEKQLASYIYEQIASLAYFQGILVRL